MLSLGIPSMYPLLDNLLNRICNSETKFKLVCYTYSRYLVNTRRRVKKYVDKYGVLGLTLFVSIPLPVTGIWTGGIAAYLLGYSKMKASLSLLLGGVISNLLVSLTLRVV